MTIQDRIAAQTAAAKARTATGTQVDLKAARTHVAARTAARRAAGLAEGTLPREVGKTQLGVNVTDA